MGEVAPRHLASEPAVLPAQAPPVPLAHELARSLVGSAAGAAWQLLHSRAAEASATLAGAGRHPSPAVALLSALTLPPGMLAVPKPSVFGWPGCFSGHLHALYAPRAGALTAGIREEAGARAVLAALLPALLAPGSPPLLQAAFAAWWGRLPPALARTLAPRLAHGLRPERAPGGEELVEWEDLVLAPLALLACRPAVWAAPALVRSALRFAQPLPLSYVSFAEDMRGAERRRAWWQAWRWTRLRPGAWPLPSCWRALQGAARRAKT